MLLNCKMAFHKLCFFVCLITLSLVFAQAITTNSFAAEKERFAFVRNDNIWAANTDGSDSKQLTSSQENRDPVISPNGKLIAYTSGHDELTGFGNVYLIPVTGGTPKKLELKGMRGSEHANFSPDGKSLIFVGMSDMKVKKKEGYDMTYATMSISIVELNTGKIKGIESTKNVLLDAGYIYSSPSFSPDGKLIAYQHSGSDVSGGFSVIELKGKTIFHFPKKSTDPTPYWRPLFSSDGKKILCHSPATNEKETDSIYLIGLSTGTKKKIAEGTNPTFVDNGKAIIFERWTNKWSPEGNTKSDLWYLELKEGTRTKQIIKNASQPTGHILSILQPKK
jgi:Tol biopolymer transport system component